MGDQGEYPVRELSNFSKFRWNSFKFQVQFETIVEEVPNDQNNSIEKLIVKVLKILYKSQIYKWFIFNV